MLEETTRPLCRVHDLAMLDLDGVVYIGGAAVPHAAEALTVASRDGLRLAFVTNNASRTPEEVADQLTSLGVPAAAGDVVTSAQAAARLLHDRLGAGAPVAVLGAGGLAAAVADAGLTPVGVEDEAAALVTGYGPEVPWRDIMRAAARVGGGLWWVAANADMTIPTAYGIAPGHGVLVDLIRRFAGVEPVVAGKPARPLFDETLRRVGGARALMVGDRLDTDIAGAVAAGLPSLLVLTGVTGLAELATAPASMRPTYLAADLRGLSDPQPAPAIDGLQTRLGGWVATTTDGRLDVGGDGGADNWWRAAASACWLYLDATGDSADVGAASTPER